MGFWKRLFGIESKSARILTSADLADELWRTRVSRSGVSVSWERAIEVSTVLACARVIANGVSQVPFRLFREVDGSRRAASDHPLYQVLYRRPNQWQTSYELRETLMFHVLLTGNAFVFVNRAGGRVYELIPIEPHRVTVRRRSDYSLVYTVTAETGATQDFEQETIWHIRGMSWDSWMGLDAVRLAREAIGLTISLEQGQAEFQANGAQTSGVLSPKGKLSPERYEHLAKWLDKHLPGGERFGKPLILDDDARYTPLSMSAIDQQLIESRRLQIEEICRAFGVMPIMVGHTDKTATYASAEQMFLAHVVHTLSPWYQRLEQSADVNLLTEDEIRDGYYTKFTPNALMRGAAKDRGEFYAKALGAGGTKGWATQNEVRAWEEMDRLDDPEADQLPQPPNSAASEGEEAPAEQE